MTEIQRFGHGRSGRSERFVFFCHGIKLLYTWSVVTCGAQEFTFGPGSSASWTGVGLEEVSGTQRLSRRHHHKRTSVHRPFHGTAHKPLIHPQRRLRSMWLIPLRKYGFPGVQNRAKGLHLHRPIASQPRRLGALSLPGISFSGFTLHSHLLFCVPTEPQMQRF